MPLASIAQTGFAASSAYDTHRPSYESDAIDRFLQVLEVEGQKSAQVLDLAAGTGKLTELLSARPEAFQITAVDPHDGMRKELEQKQLDRVKVVRGTAESMPAIADGSIAAVTVAQAFHWFSNMDALKEINRVLQDRGVLGIIWNVEDYQAPKDWKIHPGWESTMRDVMWSLDDGQPRFRNMEWQKVFDEQGRSDPISINTAEPLFGLPIGQDTVEFTSWLPREELWKRFQTYSQIANLDHERYASVEKTFNEAVNASNVMKDEHGRIAVHGKAFFAWTSKIPSEPLQQ